MALALPSEVFEMTEPQDLQQLIFKMDALALQARQQGKYDEALKVYEKEISIAQELLGPDDPNIATLLNNIAAVNNLQGKHTSAIALNRRALVIRRKALGEGHPAVSGDLTDLALSMLQNGQIPEAEHLLGEAYELQRNLAQSAANLLPWLIEVGKFAMRPGGYEIAVKLFSTAKNITKVFSERHPVSVQVISLLKEAKLHTEQGENE